MLTRRAIVRHASKIAAAALFTPQLQALAEERWLDLKNDEGNPVSNSKLPGELTSQLENFPSVIWTGSAGEELTLYEFYDHNCPYCRIAASDLSILMKKFPDLRLGLINNPILSALSKQSAKVEVALLKLEGPVAAYQLQQKLLRTKGVVNGERALQAAEGLGIDRERLEHVAGSTEVGAILDLQIRGAADLGLSTTPAFVLGNSSISSYPGPKTLEAVIAASKSCGEIVC